MKIFIIYFLITVLILGGCVGAKSPEGTSAPTTASAEPVTVPTTQPTPTEPETIPTENTTPSTEPSTEPPPVLTVPETILAGMTTEEKIGQLFLARCPDINAAEDAAAYHLGGFILFGRDFSGLSYEEVCADIASYQAAARIPMLIAVDEEGGTVCRVSSQSQFRSSRFRSPRSLYDEGGLDLILSTEQEKISLLRSFGINVNMAPVCDVTTDPDAFMYSRSLGQSPEVTGQFISSVVDLMDENSFGGVLKHFPGYGNNTDTHVGIAIDERTLAELEAVDLVPFAAGIEAGADAIMISHTFVNCLDSEHPASLSPNVVGYLRNEMGFEGVIVTDDLAMQAITDLYGDGEAAVLAVQAGVDLLCTTDYHVQYDAILAAVHDGRISQEALDAAVLRILNWKLKLGLLERFA